MLKKNKSGFFLFQEIGRCSNMFSFLQTWLLHCNLKQCVENILMFNFKGNEVKYYMLWTWKVFKDILCWRNHNSKILYTTNCPIEEKKTGKKQGVKLLTLVQGVSKRKYIIQAGSSVSQCLTVYKTVTNLRFTSGLQFKFLKKKTYEGR